MTFVFRLARPLLLCLLLLPFTAAHASDAQPAADPKIWGVYAQLVGHRFKAPADGWPGYEIVWSKPGEEIRESKLWFNTNEVEWTRLVRPGARPGELIASGTGEYNKTTKDWAGTIGTDGSVSFALREGLLKAPYRITGVGGGLKFEQTGAPPFAFLPEAVAPAATAIASVAPTQTTADPAVWGVYAHLVGHRFKAPSSESPDYEIVWTKPGEEMKESTWYGNQLGAMQLIRPGDRVGQLIATRPRSVVDWVWVGTIDTDGSVLFIRDSLQKIPYRVGMAADGSLIMQEVKLKDGKLASITRSTPHAREGGPEVAAVVPAPNQPVGNTGSVAASNNAVPSATTATNVAAPAAGSWGVLEKLAGKTWQRHNTGRWESDASVLNYSWSADRSTITLSGGDGYASRQIGTYRVDPVTGHLIADTQDQDGKPIQAPAQVDGDGTVTAQLGKKRRSITAIDSESGALRRTVQKLTWGGDWKDIETYWYFDADPGPEWGVFSKLVGYNWTLNGHVSLHFRWLPQSRVVEASIYHNYSYEGGINYSLREGHPHQLVSRGEGSEYQLFGAPVGLTVLKGDTEATQISGKNRYRYELLSSPDRVLLHSEKWVDGELKKTTGTFHREDQSQKNERIAGVNNYLRHKEASDRTTRTLQNQAALYNVLTAANEVAAARVAQSQAELDATLDTLAEQAQYERMEAAAQQAAAEEAARQRAREREQDATVAAAMAQARQLAREAGDEGAADRAIVETNRAIDQQAEARKQRIAAQEREAQLNAQQQMKQFVQSSQAQQAQQARPQSAPKPAATATGGDAGAGSYVYMGCEALHGASKTAYLSDIARIPMVGEQERWNAVFFAQFIAGQYNLAQRDIAHRCYLDRNSEAGARSRRELARKANTGNGFSNIEIDWSPEKRY